MIYGDRLLAGHASPVLSCASDEATDGFIAIMIIKNLKFELISNNPLITTIHCFLCLSSNNLFLPLMRSEKVQSRITAIICTIFETK